MRIILLLAVLGCAHNVKHEPIPVEPGEFSVAVEEKRAFYCEAARETVETNRYAVAKGDGFLFTALHSLACGYPGVARFCDQWGKCYRDPDQTPISWEWNSTFSKDMATGLLLYAAKSGDKDLISRWIDYGDSHDWKVGDAVENEVGLVIMTPDIVTLAFDVRAYLRGDSERAARDESYAGQQGYQAHLSVLRQLIKHTVNGGLTDRSLDILRTQADREPENALYQCAMGLYDAAYRERGMRLLALDPRWPEDTLPNNHEHHSSDYLYQRDYDADEADSEADDYYPDWLPLPQWKIAQGRVPFHEFDGTDYSFAAYVCGGM